MRIMLFGTYDTSMHPRIATIAEGLAASGHDVTECNAPLGLSTADRVSMLAQPWRVPALLARLVTRWVALAAQARRLPAPDAVVVGYLGHFDVHLARLLFGRRMFGPARRRRRIPIVLDHLVGASDTGRDRRLDGGARQILLRMIDAGALSAADVIVVDTEEHLAALPEAHRERGVVVAVGAPAAWYDAAPDPGNAADEITRPRGAEGPPGRALPPAPPHWTDSSPPRGAASDQAARAGSRSEAEGPGREPDAVTASTGAGFFPGGRGGAEPPRETLRVVFYGLYTPLQGVPVIGAALGRIAAAQAANRGARIEVTMVGRGQDEAETKAAASANRAVRWLDWVPAAELPALVARHDVCLGIFGTGEKARRVVPNKVFQGAAAGCAIVTSDTPPQRRVFGDSAVLVPPGDADALAGALLRLADDRAALRELRGAARQLAVKRFAPAQVVVPLLDRLASPRLVR